MDKLSKSKKVACLLIILIFLFSSEVGMMYIRKADLGLGNSTKRVEGAIQITNFYRNYQIFFNIDEAKKRIYIYSATKQIWQVWKTYAFIKKSTILTQSLLKIFRMRYSWGPHFDKVS